MEDLEAETKRLGIELIFPSTLLPLFESNRIHMKSLKMAISIPFVRHMDNMRNAIREAFIGLPRSLALLPLGFDRILQPCHNYGVFYVRV